MENVLLIAASRQMALRREMDVIANNVANVTTNGFQRRMSDQREYKMPVASMDQFRKGADRKISFVVDNGTPLDTSLGTLEPTGNPLDVALSAGSYFAVQTPQGERYTRNGALMINTQGQLVNSDGHVMLGSQGPFQFTAEDTGQAIATDGTVSTGNGVSGKLRIVEFANPQSLENKGANLFSSTTPPAVAAQARVQSGMLERSNVKAVVEISRMIEVNRQYQAVANMISKADDTRRNAIQKLSETI